MKSIFENLIIRQSRFVFFWIYVFSLFFYNDAVAFQNSSESFQGSRYFFYSDESLGREIKMGHINEDIAISDVLCKVIGIFKGRVGRLIGSIMLACTALGAMFARVTWSVVIIMLISVACILDCDRVIMFVFGLDGGQEALCDFSV